MLVLSRKLNESIVIGDNIRITIVGIQTETKNGERCDARIKIGIVAPDEISVDREEVREKKEEIRRKEIAVGAKQG